VCLSLANIHLPCLAHVPKPDGASSALKKWQQQSALPISCNCPQHVSGQFHGYSEKSDPQPFGGASKNSSPAVGPRHRYPSWKCQTSRSQKGAYHTLSWHWPQCVCVCAPLRLHPLTKDVKDPTSETQWARQRGCQLMSCMCLKGKQAPALLLEKCCGNAFIHCFAFERQVRHAMPTCHPLI